MPYISPKRNIDEWLLDAKPVPKRNMVTLKNNLPAGDIILLWRIEFGTFTTETWFPKYFEYTYGINAPENLKKLEDEGYVEIESACSSLDHINSIAKKNILKQKGVKGLSKLKAADLDKALEENFSEEELAKLFSIRGYKLTQKEEKALLDNRQAFKEKYIGCILNPGHGKIPAPDFNFYIQKDKYPI